MNTPLEQKSSIDEIRKRFDNDVKRFSNIETGQAATIDASLAMELITLETFKSTGSIKRVLDIGSGAGNNTIKLSQYAAPFDCDFIEIDRTNLLFAESV